MSAPVMNRRILPSSLAEWDQVFRRRASIAEREPVDAFFFELDWQAEPNFGAAAKRVGRNPVLSAKEWPELAMVIDLRLEARWGGYSPSTLAPTPLVARLSRMIHGAAARLGGNGTVGKALERWGAGALRSGVDFGTRRDPGTYFINDADSYFIWYFAEFGLMAIEMNIDRAKWKPMLKSLVLAAWLYSHRFTGPMPLTAYLHPGAPLTARRITELTRVFDAIWRKGRSDAGEALGRCLREVCTCYRV